MDPSAPPTEAVVLLEHAEGIERESIAAALQVSRNVWIEQTCADYWSDIPHTTREQLAGELWERIHRMNRARVL